MSPEPTTGVGVSPASFAPGEVVVHRFSHAAMATVFEVHCVHDDAVYAGQAAQAAFEVVDRLEQALSRFVANSDVSRINHLRAGESTRVSPEALECLLVARHMFDLTGGAFDVSIGTGLDQLELVPDEFRVRVHAEGLRLDLGGIGKGYAVDLMAERLAEWDAHQALVHGGFSSVRALDAPPDRDGWPLTLSAPWPRDQETLARVLAHHMALSASGSRKGGHIVEPRTGRAAVGRAAWSAVHGAVAGDRAAALAEGLSTAFLILPVSEVEGLCDRCPEVEAWLSVDSGEKDASSKPLIRLRSSGGIGRVVPRERDRP